MKVKVVKLSTNDNTFRTALDQLDGLPFAPEIDKRLIITSDSHESGGIITSLVQNFTVTDYGYLVITEHSTYEITKY